MWTIENKKEDRQAKSSLPSVHVYVLGGARYPLSPLDIGPGSRGGGASSDRQVMKQQNGWSSNEEG